MKRIAKFIFAGVMSAMVTGCAVMSEEECRSTNWYERGYADGTKGVGSHFHSVHRILLFPIYVQCPQMPIILTSIINEDMLCTLQEKIWQKLMNILMFVLSIPFLWTAEGLGNSCAQIRIIYRT